MGGCKAKIMRLKGCPEVWFSVISSVNSNKRWFNHQNIRIEPNSTYGCVQKWRKYIPELPSNTFENYDHLAFGTLGYRSADPSWRSKALFQAEPKPGRDDPMCVAKNSIVLCQWLLEWMCCNKLLATLYMVFALNNGGFDVLLVRKSLCFLSTSTLVPQSTCKVSDVSFVVRNLGISTPCGPLVAHFGCRPVFTSGWICGVL